MKLFRENGTPNPEGLCRLRNILQDFPPGAYLIIAARYGKRATPLHYVFDDGRITTVDDTVARIVDYVKSLREAARGLDYRLCPLHTFPDPDAYLQQIRDGRKLDEDTLTEVDEEDDADAQVDDMDNNPLIEVVKTLAQFSQGKTAIELSVTQGTETLVTVGIQDGHSKVLSNFHSPKRRRIASN